MGGLTALAFGLQPFEIGLTLLGHLSQDSRGLGIGDHVGEPATLSDPAAHMVEGVIGHSSAR